MINRHDLDESTTLNERELLLRWGNFHAAIQQANGTPLRRLLGRWLGHETTWRYRTARVVFRPLLQLRRALRGKPPTTVAHVAEITHGPFPLNYEPRSATENTNHAALDHNMASVVTVAINEIGTDPERLIHSLNETIAVSGATWLFLVDVSHTSFARVETLATLLAQTSEDLDVLFGDESGTNHLQPILKPPAVGPHSLLSYNVVGRPALIRLARLRDIGGFDESAGWAFEHDAYLRLQEHNAVFHHVPVVLPAGRVSVAFSASHVDDDTARIVSQALTRRQIHATVTTTDFAGLVRWSPEVPATTPSIDIVIPTRDRIDLVKKCIASIEERSTYKNWNIIICDNDSVKPESLEYFATTKYRVVPCPGPFNYAKIVNQGIRTSTADFILTLNNDTEVVTPDWLEQLLALAALPDVSIVGACLLDVDGRREHESIVIAPYPQHLRTDGNYPHRDAFSLALRDVAAVTGAVQMVRRDLWESLGGMDEELHVVMNDVDVCLRSQLDGKHVVYTPYVQLHHEVGASRGTLDPLDDRNRFIRRWDIFGSFVDPYFPELLTLLGERMYFRTDKYQV
jgi:O-antigen biosynthesis protein